MGILNANICNCCDGYFHNSCGDYSHHSDGTDACTEDARPFDISKTSDAAAEASTSI
jgi:hypothetical protein